MYSAESIIPSLRRFSKAVRRVFGDRENIIYGLLHIAGLIIAAGCTALLIVLNALDRADPWKIVSYSLFCGGLIMYYGFSTISHILYISERVHRVISKIDYCILPFMVAACFMPVCLIALRRAVGWTLFGMVWAYAILAIIQRAFRPKRNVLKTIALSLLCIDILIAIVLLTHIIPITSIFFLTLGGLFYTTSAMVFPYRLLHYEKGFIRPHSLSHILMICGTVCHFILLYITTL